MPLDPEAWVPLAEVMRPHGVRGEVRLKLFNKDSDTLLDQDEILLRFPEGDEQEVSVDAARRADDAILMKLFSIDDRDRADELRGAVICIRRRDLPKLDAGEFYAVDVVGAEVVHDGTRLGEVVELMSYPSVDVLRVRADDGAGDWEIPLTEGFVRSVDTAARRVEIVTLEGIEREVKKAPKPPRPPRIPRHAKAPKPKEE